MTAKITDKMDTMQVDLLQGIEENMPEKEMDTSNEPEGKIIENKHPVRMCSGY